MRRASAAERRSIVASTAALGDAAARALEDPSAFGVDRAEAMIENAISVYGLPLGIATNFVVNGREVLVPMVVEEPSVVAGASWAAKASRSRGGFRTSSTERDMIAQVHLTGIADPVRATSSILDARDLVLAECARFCARMVARGGGPKGVDVRELGSGFLAVHLVINTIDAMGANSVNAVAEGVAPLLEQLSGGRAVLKILSNYTLGCVARAEVDVPVSMLEKRAADGSDSIIAGSEVLDGVLLAQRVSEIDEYRAVTHNKGVMNGVDAVVVATGNDWRAVEAAAHAYASRFGRYGPLTSWSRTADGDLRGSIELPMSVGTVGGTIPLHPMARACLEILGVSSARELAEICVSVGLAQNLAALRALVSFGIQASHMGLHARSVAAAGGARGADIERVAEALIQLGDVRVERAAALVSVMQADRP
ncbi:MAG: hydroxymethylglutaryl-CoA reductase, degradative [Deltaproteobacteria bacterium]|nr:hydroxymethylglutaryl-CoA reductase, degradative [Deltaproteobacteria bacterium]